MYIVILAGGSGTRFWPLSRKSTPKQLMSVFGGKSMLQRTVERVLPLDPKRVLVITNALQAAETRAQLSCIEGVPVDVIEEPVGRNTAPAIGLAASIIARFDPDGIMVVLPADHYIVDEETFRATLAAARSVAVSGALVTLGITPTRPETGYGYIEAAEPADSGAAPVKRFVEKPNLERAVEFLASGRFYWNSGMFVWGACAILDQIGQHMPELSRALAKLCFESDVWELSDLKPQIADIYGGIKGESIDFGVMEKAKDVQVIPASFGWSDVGSWSALPEVMEADAAGHVVINSSGAVSVGAKECLAYGNGKVVAFVGVSDLIVVDTPDALLVCSKGAAQDVKKVVEELERQGKLELL
ncbi:sugar phosphate nucleotidyltransferase [Geomonas paludis]|uniref:mannose-1-phosphate guanylyltransferase n=1 Tax=Geomonas paludis TaxID=2740185 RepID=A0A6V8MZC7_9BACT|nr:mannose-1-phosphate guanylyltransferase [Geomonas paludis]UPU35119.1 sugar phosphate nucleotidyltransferase [Geomonas paludis]GFO65440.1 mannose-1-phosphate guanylyltransferase [Geomonas paludis]